MSKVQKFCNLHTFVKKENPELYNILEDMCAVGLFRPKYPTTFINPSKEVVAKLKSMVDKGDSDLAFEELQKHFIYGKHTSLSGELINYNSKVVKSDLSKITKKSGNTHLWKSKEGNVVVYNQTNGDLLEEGETKKRPKLESSKTKKGKGESIEEDRVIATRELLDMSKNSNIMHVFAKHVNGLLTTLQKLDENKFSEVSSKLDSNPVVCWYILVKPCKYDCSGCDNYISNEVFNEWFNNRKENPNNRMTSLLRETFKSGETDREKAKQARNKRNNLDLNGFKNAVSSVISSYDNDLCVLLEDEVRFRFSDMDDKTLTPDSSEISELNQLNWGSPSESLVMFKEDSTLLCPLLYKVIQQFVESSAFHYTMFNDSILEKLEGNIVGAGLGAKKVVKILGKEGRKLIKTMEDSGEEEELGKFVSSLTAKQANSLKKILKSL
jgi:hypothetical protein